MRAWAGISFFGAAALGLAMIAGPASARAASLEFPVKAAFLSKFAPFVQWPPTAYPAPDSAISVCIVGADPFGTAIDQAVQGQHLGAHPLVVRRLDKIDASSGCSIAYLGGSKAQSIEDGLAAVQGTPVLTVTDQAMSSVRGAIHFVVRDNRVRFMIDDEAAAKNGMNISSKLMRLALSVHLRSGGRL